MSRRKIIFIFPDFYCRLPSPSQSRSINQHRLITNRSCSHLSVERISEAISSGGGGGKGREKKGISTRKGTKDGSGRRIGPRNNRSPS